MSTQCLCSTSACHCPAANDVLCGALVHLLQGNATRSTPAVHIAGPWQLEQKPGSGRVCSRCLLVVYVWCWAAVWAVLLQVASRHSTTEGLGAKGIKHACSYAARTQCVKVFCRPLFCYR
jgi:hypothetical protein